MISQPMQSFSEGLCKDGRPGENGCAKTGGLRWFLTACSGDSRDGERDGRGEKKTRPSRVNRPDRMAYGKESRLSSWSVCAPRNSRVAYGGVGHGVLLDPFFGREISHRLGSRLVVLDDALDVGFEGGAARFDNSIVEVAEDVLPGKPGRVTSSFYAVVECFEICVAPMHHPPMPVDLDHDVV